MDTPSLVIVGAPHFFSSTTLRPLGPRVTRTASASLFMPASRPRRASWSNAICFGIWLSSVGRSDERDENQHSRTASASTLQPRLLAINETGGPDRPAVRAFRQASAAGDGRDDGDGDAVGDRRV